MFSVTGILATLCLILGFAAQAPAGVVDIHDNRLFIDGQAQPQLFGAEIQYFRLRGGLGRNIPREKVIALWNRVLDHAVEARMNAVSFYIPWDFHEYAEGKFDFDGTVDEDGDGLPDYPSRDVRTFIKLVLEHGIHNILVRPGPYVNAEWGFAGFGAVPEWFHEKYRDSHMVNPQGLRTTLYSYRDPQFLASSKNWLRTVYEQVVKPYIGPGKPISFLQLDNETNFQWASLYMQDYSERSRTAYRDFLRKRYGDIAHLNAAHRTAWTDFSAVQPPVVPKENLAADQDWYRFADETVHEYLHAIRQTWEELGVREPNVLFTLAESFNSFDDGLLPNPQLKNDRGVTGMMTVNLYPKTEGTAEQWLLDHPFKADHDVKSADTASDNYLGSKQEWVMGPEIQGGWWRDTEVTTEARRQTYLSTIGHGLKALFIYYFNEGENWQVDWATKQVRKIYEKLHQDPRYAGLAREQLPAEFWNELNAATERNIFAYWNGTWYLDHPMQAPMLDFDAPVGPNGEARPPFALVREIGEKIVAAHGDFLAGATEYTDSVCLVKDAAALVPSPDEKLNSQWVQSHGAAGIVGYLMQVGINPRVLHWNWTERSEFERCRVLVYLDTGFTTPELIAQFRSTLERGGGVLTFLHNSVGDALFPKGSGCGDATIAGFATSTKCVYGGPDGKQGLYFHSDDPVYGAINETTYGHLLDIPQRTAIARQLLQGLHLRPQLAIRDGGDRVVVFGRLGADRRTLWATVKSGQPNGFTGHVVWAMAEPATNYRVRDVFSGETQMLRGDQLRAGGFHFKLGANGSTAFLIEPL